MSSFGGSVKLTGESEYRKALSEITSNLKVLNSEMKTVTSLYDKNDTSVENLSSQNEILNKKIAEQEKAVKILADALEKSKAETGENSSKTNEWQIKLNNAKAELNKLNREVADNSKKMEDAQKNTQEEAKAIEDFGEEAEESGEKSLKLGDIIKANLISDAIKGGLQALANGFKAIGSAIGDCLTGGAEYADTILTLSVQTGLSTDTLEKYNAVAELTDVSMDTLTNSMAKNIKSMSNARDGSKAYAEAYEKLGVSVTNADGTLRDSETVYWETIDALKGINNETERDALAMEIFGKSAQDLNTIIALGSNGVAEYTDKAESMGAVLGGKGLEALGNLDDQMQIFKGSLSSTKNIIASAFAPALASALEGVNGLAGSFNQLLTAVISGDEGGVESAMTMISEQVTALVQHISENAPKIMGIVTSLLKTLLQVISENLPTLIQCGMDMLMSILNGIVENLDTIIPCILSVFETLINAILTNLPMIIEMGIQIIVALANGIAEMLPTLIPTVIDCILTIIETILDNIDMIIDAGINIIMGLVDGIMNALPTLIDRIPVIIDKLITAITDNLPKLIEMGIQLTLKLVVGIIKAIPQLVSKVPQIITSLVNGLMNGLSKIWEVGKNLVAGLWEGIKGAAAWLWDKVSGWISDLWDGILDFFGIASPSKKMKYVGKMMVDGMAISIDENGGEAVDSALQMSEDVMSAFDTINADGVATAMADISNAIPNEINTDISANLNASQSQMQTYDMMVSAFKKALTEVKVVMDDREMGGFVTDTIERVVFA